MSLETSIKRVKVPFARGSDREVFYSKKYDVVIKKTRKDSFRGEKQYIIEKNLFYQLTEKEKEIFPIIDVREEDKIIIMHYCKRLTRKQEDLYHDFYMSNFNYKEYSNIPMAKEFSKFVKKYRITDLHPANIGIYNGHFVIVDAGYRHLY